MIYLCVDFRYLLICESKVISEVILIIGVTTKFSKAVQSFWPKQHICCFLCRPAGGFPVRIHWQNNKRTFSGALLFLLVLITRFD